MIKNIIFDIGNVCVTFQPVAYFQSHFHDQVKARQLCEHIFQHALWRKYDQGLLNMEALKQAFLEVLKDDPTDVLFVLDHWKAIMQPIASTFALMQELKQKGMRLYVLSNISEESALYLKQRMSFFTLVDGEVLSYKEKLLKPDKAIYMRLLDTYGLCASECIFIDDIKENVEQSIQLGMHGVVYASESQVYAEVMHLMQEEFTC